MSASGAADAAPAPRTVLVAGATGLIGAALAEALVARGHRVLAAARRPPARAGMQPLAVDFAERPQAHWWLPRLAGVDVVVNAVGIFREQGRQSFDALHRAAPVALFEAAAQAGVRLVLQLSALGADDAAPTAFLRSKHAADQALRALPLPSVVVQPSLVYAPQGASTRLMRRLAALPLRLLPAGEATVQPVHLDDLVQALVAMVERPPASACTVPAVGPRALTVPHYLALLRTAMGWTTPARTLWLSPRKALAGAALAARLPGALLDPDAVRMLLRGHQAAPAPLAAWLGRPARPVQQFVPAAEAPALRAQALLDNALPLLRLSVAAVWIWTGCVSLGLYPVAGSLELLADFGLHGAPALAALYAGALIDLALGLALLLAPARWRRPLWAAQLLVIAGYTLLISWRIPHWWLHPFGPISKNLPMLAAIALLWAAEAPRR